MHQSWSSADSCSGISLRFIPFLHSFCLYPWNSLPLIYPCSVLKAASFQHSLLLHHLKNKQPLKFSHYLQFKVPTLLDGLQGLQEFCSADHPLPHGQFCYHHPNSLQASSYSISSICSSPNLQSSCKLLHMLFYFPGTLPSIFSLENFYSISRLNWNITSLDHWESKDFLLWVPLSPMV